MSELYIDNTARKRIVTFWIPVCLGFLHFWGTLFAVALIIPAGITEYGAEQLEAIVGGVKICGYGVVFMILLLISDKTFEYFVTRATNAIPAIAPATVKEITTKERIVVPAAVPAEQVGNVEIQADNVDIHSK